MAQTFFIDSDEEIISVIGYLRKSPEVENCFVFPKRSLVLQSAVNLRLFQREAEKQGKRIVIISQDENGRQLAERVGIPTKDYAAEMNALRPEVVVSMGSKETASQSFQHGGSHPSNLVRDEQAPFMPLSNHLGSDTFAASPASSASPSKSMSYPLRTNLQQLQPAPHRDEHRLRIRDTSPQYQTSLNSVRSDVRPPEKTAFRPLVHSETSSPVSTRRPSDVRPESMRQHEDLDSSDRSQRLERFFQRGPSDSLSPVIPTQSGVPVSTQPQSKVPTFPSVALPPISKPIPVKSGSSWRGLAIFTGGIVVLSGIGVAVYFFLPKASVVITPHEITHEVEVKFEGRTIVPIGNSSDNSVPVRKIEKEYMSNVTMESSGRASSENQKARGILVITNEYSSDAQPLIATTRFETSDRKIFRLVESVTVPGVTIVDGKRQPGVVEAVVIADAPGDAYNIAPADFTITGFKGGLKYDKIRARSSKGFSGGGGNEESISSITKENIDSAVQKLKEQSKQDFIAAVQQELLPEERILTDSIEVNDQVMGGLPLAGSLGERFDIEGKFLGRAFVVSEKILKEKLAERNLPERKGVSFRVTDATLSFAGVLPRYDEDRVTFDARAMLMLSSVIDTAGLKVELLGSDEAGIKSILEKHAEIKKIEVSFSPEFLFRNIPKNEKRVLVEVVSDQ
ncbi:MAG: hypothetical protein KA054_01040 [Candidatus Moranbacteria bacterium]|nr:hypothetical protein [Candidatus Moranbacteria bacterium]